MHINVVVAVSYSFNTESLLVRVFELVVLQMKNLHLIRTSSILVSEEDSNIPGIHSSLNISFSLLLP